MEEQTILVGKALVDALRGCRTNYRYPIIVVGSHSPAYHFPNLPVPDAIFRQRDAQPVCFWIRFDWHVMFANAMSKAAEVLGFICIRPDERAKEPVGWKIRDNLISIHCPSVMLERIKGADCIETSENLLAYLEDMYKEPPFPWMIVMAPGSTFGRRIIKAAGSFVPPGHLVAHALGDTPSLFSTSRLKRLFLNCSARDKLRFAKHLFSRVVNTAKERDLYRNVSFLWVPTEESRLYWRDFLSCPMAYTSGGYDADTWLPGDKLKARRLLGLSEKESVILSNCVLIPKKRLDDLIRAVDLLGRDNFKLIITGYGEQSERRRLEALVKELEINSTVIFTGYVEEERLVLFYHAADVFVHLSAAEGGPAACKQALAVNLPVVMTPVGSVGKWIKETSMGRLFPVGDVQSCARNISEILKQSNYPETSKPARELWSWEAIGRRMSRDLLDLIEKE